MAFEYNDNTGSLFQNDKEGNPKRPDYRGKAKIDGKMLNISAWIKETKKGGKFLSINFQPDEEKPAQKPKPEIANEDVPF